MNTSGHFYCPVEKKLTDKIRKVSASVKSRNGRAGNQINKKRKEQLAF